jgi:hypothetical protein
MIIMVIIMIIILPTIMLAEDRGYHRPMTASSKARCSAYLPEFSRLSRSRFRRFLRTAGKAAA